MKQMQLLGALLLMAGLSPIVTSAQQKLNELLANRDSLLYAAIFTTPNLSVINSMLQPKWVFYQDQGFIGPTSSQSRETYISGIQKMWQEKKQENGQMRRDVVKSSLAIFPISIHEVLQTGTQHFYIVKRGQKDQLVEESKFSRVWHQDNGQWTMTLEMDYSYNTHLGDDPGH